MFSGSASLSAASSSSDQPQEPSSRSRLTADALGSSSDYRDQLKYIFTIDWLNPMLGIGRKRSFASEINGSFIQSIDNFYIAEYVRYAYPGLAAYVLILLYYLYKMNKTL